MITPITFWMMVALTHVPFHGHDHRVHTTIAWFPDKKSCFTAMHAVMDNVVSEGPDLELSCEAQAQTKG